MMMMMDVDDKNVEVGDEKPKGKNKLLSQGTGAGTASSGIVHKLPKTGTNSIRSSNGKCRESQSQADSSSKLCWDFLYRKCLRKICRFKHPRKTAIQNGNQSMKNQQNQNHRSAKPVDKEKRINQRRPLQEHRMESPDGDEPKMGIAKIVFCHDFQNNFICNRLNCKFLHRSLDDQDYYQKYGEFPVAHFNSDIQLPSNDCHRCHYSMNGLNVCGCKTENPEFEPVVVAKLPSPSNDWKRPPFNLPPFHLPPPPLRRQYLPSNLTRQQSQQSRKRHSNPSGFLTKFPEELQKQPKRDDAERLKINLLNEIRDEIQQPSQPPAPPPPASALPSINLKVPPPVTQQQQQQTEQIPISNQFLSLSLPPQFLSYSSQPSIVFYSSSMPSSTAAAAAAATTATASASMPIQSATIAITSIHDLSIIGSTTTSFSSPLIPTLISSLTQALLSSSSSSSASPSSLSTQVTAARSCNEATASSSSSTASTFTGDHSDRSQNLPITDNIKFTLEMVKSLRCLEEEFMVLKRRMQAYEIKYNELRQSNEFLLQQNAQLRLTNAAQAAAAAAAAAVSGSATTETTVTVFGCSTAAIVNPVTVTQTTTTTVPIVSIGRQPTGQIIATSNCGVGTQIEISTTSGVGAHQQLASLTQPGVASISYPVIGSFN